MSIQADHHIKLRDGRSLGHAQVGDLASQFGIERFAVQGWSGGGPFVAACAYQIPRRLTACGIVGGMGPIHLGTQGMMGGLRMMYFVAQRLPWLAGPFLCVILGRYARNPAAAR